jgi:hypothetical protein
MIPLKIAHHPIRASITDSISRMAWTHPAFSVETPPPESMRKIPAAIGASILERRVLRQFGSL